MCTIDGTGGQRDNSAGDGSENTNDEDTGEEIETILGSVTARGSSKKDWIEDNLKRIYEEVAEEPVPDDMLELLKQLDDNGSDSENTPDSD